MTPSNDVLVSDALLEDKFVTIWPDNPCVYDVRSVDFRNRDLLQKAMEAIGSNWIRHIFRKYHAGSNIGAYFLPRLSVCHGTDGIARIKNILKYYILMSVVLYISNDTIINYGHKCTHIFY